MIILYLMQESKLNSLEAGSYARGDLAQRTSIICKFKNLPEYYLH